MKETYTTEDGSVVPIGRLCRYSCGYLITCDSTGAAVKFNASIVPDDYIELYDESPCYREYRKCRERIATTAMQAILNGLLVNTELLADTLQRFNLEGCWTLGAFVARQAVGYADELLKELSIEKS